MKLVTLAHLTHGHKRIPQIFQYLPRDLVMVFQKLKNGVKCSVNFERLEQSPGAKIKNFEI